MANDKFAKWTFPLNFGWNILVQICILEKNEKKDFYLHFFHDTAQRIDARNNNDHNTNRRWSQAVVIFCLYLNEHVATMSPRATEHIKDFKSLGWHQCGFISPIASSHKYCGKKKQKKSLSSKMATQISTNFRKLCSCTAYNKTLNKFTKSQPYLRYPLASKKTRALHFNTGSVREHS